MKSAVVIGCALAVLALWCAAPAVADEPAVSASELPRVAPLEPAKALKNFVVKPGFRVELAATEPLVVDPIAMAFDEAGRLFVVEMRDYSERRDERLGRIRLLTDTNHDGRFDVSTVYADSLGWPTAVICWDGGVFVGCTPDILFFKDTNADGAADERKVVFTGFGEGQERLNVQGMLNSFNWSLDNRIHGAAGLNGGKIKSLANPNAAPVELRGKDFSFDPCDLRSIRPESGGGQHGMSFDNVGRKFACHNSRHIMQLMYEDYYAGRNPNYSLPSPLVDIAADGPAAEVFRLSPEEPWRVIRTKWRVAGKVSGPIEGGGRASGYFTSATGITIYRGDAFPEDYVGDAFIADVGSNLIHHKKLRGGGVALIAERPADEQKAEFIASRDLWFRPVQFANAPDGALYVADMYREVVEHPWSIPESIKKHLDLNSGNDRGRIYRIVPESFQEPKSLALTNATTEQLIAALEHRNGWRRDTAARLLYQRQDKTGVAALERLLKSSRYSHARLHALYALHGQRALKWHHVDWALSDRDPHLRAHALRLSEPRFLSNGEASSWTRKLQIAARDETPVVRFQAALSLGEPNPTGVQNFADVAQAKPSDPWVEAALLQSLSSGAADLFITLVRAKDSAALSENFLRQLAQMVGNQNANELASVLKAIGGIDDFERALNLAAALAEGLRSGGKSLAAFRDALKPMLERGRTLATSSDAEESARAPAIALLGFAGDSAQVLAGLLDSGQPPKVQLAALAALDRHDDDLVADVALARWSTLSPRVRDEALTVLLKRPARAMKLLQSVEGGIVQPGELSSTRAKFLRAHRDRSVRELAARVLPSSNARRNDVVQTFQAAVAMAGDANRGRSIYLERCSSCHRLQGQGHQLGPDLETVKTTGKEKLLINIVDPNREVPANYQAYLVETKSGETFMGLLANESASGVTVRQAYGKEDILPRAQISKVQSHGQSLMPEGLEAGLTTQNVADLLEYIAPN
jgi:putative membrane-bound dehydrogenase-like protein